MGNRRQLSVRQHCRHHRHHHHHFQRGSDAADTALRTTPRPGDGSRDGDDDDDCRRRCWTSGHSTARDLGTEHPSNHPEHPSWPLLCHSRRDPRPPRPSPGDGAVAAAAVAARPGGDGRTKGRRDAAPIDDDDVAVTDDDDDGPSWSVRAFRCRTDASCSEACDCWRGVPPARRRPLSGAGYPLPREPGPLSPQVGRIVAPVDGGAAVTAAVAAAVAAAAAAAAAAAVDGGGGGGGIGGAAAGPVAVAAPPSCHRPRNFGK